jgi:hypothetical protein
LSSTHFSAPLPPLTAAEPPACGPLSVCIDVHGPAIPTRIGDLLHASRTRSAALVRTELINDDPVTPSRCAGAIGSGRWKCSKRENQP